MVNRRKLYGPLELVDGRWAVGDSALPGGRWVQFREDGMVPHTGDAPGEVIRWAGVMEGITLQIGRYSYRAGFPVTSGFDGFWSRKPGVGRLFLTLRHPYEYRTVTFDRHPHRYSATQLLLTAQLMVNTVADGEAHRLGDPEWLSRAIGRLEAVTSWPLGRGPEAVVRAALETAD
ncbi:hypothetical protein ACFV1L_26600 [Kitasatospora sp. NPDC059646]|uniref:hypothetical protein n=1 Tax=Kitasatospora sp. NPDC059646 TaxID=3346893 RepID=UPI00369DD87D